MRALLPILALTTALAGAAAPPRVPAFPGAEGAGRWTPGGRGGRVLLVTTLADYRPGREPVVPGSLRAAADAAGPRIVVFRVGGTIALKADLAIREPRITIAGQTAPGGGICLRDYPLNIRTHDVIARHLRVRPGDTARREMDGLDVIGQNVIIDHCSVSWGIDETLSVTKTSDRVTVQWCFITESLNRSVHQKGEHGYGSLINGVGPITFHHNLYAYHKSRNPRPGDVLLDFRNNVIHGWRLMAGYCADEPLRMNYVGNWIEPLAYSRSAEWAFCPGSANARIYIEGSVMPARPDATAANWMLVKPPPGCTEPAAPLAMRASRPFAVEPVRTDAAAVAYRRVLEGAGATLPQRDAVDRRVAGLVRRGAGRIIDSQADVGGWPDLAPGAPEPDADLDGLPDRWERAHGLDPANPADAAEVDRSTGYAWIERYANGLRVAPGGASR